MRITSSVFLFAPRRPFASKFFRCYTRVTLKLFFRENVKMKTRTFRIASLVILFGVILLGGTRAARAAPQTALRTPVILQAAQADAIFRIPAPPRSPTRAPTASINISYIPAGSLNSYGYTCQTWPAGSQTAFAYAASLWATRLVSSVPIVVEACWVNLGYGVLGATGSGLWRFTDTWYSLAAANAIAAASEYHVSVNRQSPLPVAPKTP